MGAFLGLTGFFGFLACLIKTLLNRIKKKPAKRCALAAVIFFGFFVLGYHIDTQGKKESDDSSTVQTTEQTTVQTTVQTPVQTTEQTTVQNTADDTSSSTEGDAETGSKLQLSDVPTFSGEAFIEVNNNIPYFTDSEKSKTASFEEYSQFDSLGRCGVAFANLNKGLMPTQERGEIGSIKPSGWHTVKYNDLIEGNYLYNRCHLIAYSLAGENANPQNLITGTRYLNTVGMAPFENKVGDYIQRTDNHVLYRVTPMFEGDNLVASGVEIEGWSVEDNGSGICFNVFCYNAQPYIDIDYLTGDSSVSLDAPSNVAYNDENTTNTEPGGTANNTEPDAEPGGTANNTEPYAEPGGTTDNDEPDSDMTNTESDRTTDNDEPDSDMTNTEFDRTTDNTEPDAEPVTTTADAVSEKTTAEIQADYIVNTNSGKIHLPSCPSVDDMAEHNKWYYVGSLDELIERGYTPCKRCLE